jgi:hypothetical protein
MATKNTTNNSTSNTSKAAPKKAAAKKSRGRAKASAVKANVEAVQAATSASSNGVAALGWQVWWDLANVDGLHADLEDAMKAMGAEHCIPEIVEPVKRMMLAADRVRGRQGVIVKKAGRQNGSAVFRAVALAKAEDMNATEAEDRPTFDPTVLNPISVHEETGAVRYDKSCSVATALVDEYNRLETHFTSRRLRECILAVVNDVYGVRMRRQGGVYFVPMGDGVEERLTKLQALVRSIGECDLYMPDLPNTSEWTRSAQRSALNSLDGQYADVLGAASEFVTKMEAGELVYGRSLSSRIKTANDLKGRAALYSDILQERGERLTKAADIVSDSMKAIVEATVEVRALRKASGSERAQALAEEMLKEIAEKTRTAIEAARNEHAPIATTDDDDE